MVMLTTHNAEISIHLSDYIKIVSDYPFDSYVQRFLTILIYGNCRCIIKRISPGFDDATSWDREQSLGAKRKVAKEVEGKG